MAIWMGYDFFNGNIIVPSALVPGIHSDQFLMQIHAKLKTRPKRWRVETFDNGEIEERDNLQFRHLIM